ncbi:MAG: helix-hairpin-helix domain-containing protein [Streptococcaceae bacterium]|nr:helix-hairpin-helix domain-containing protein [Streptococcaceae bacterium]
MNWIQRNKVLLVGNISILLLLIGGVWFFSDNSQKASEEQVDIFQAKEEEVSTQSTASSQIYIDIKGQVAKPGIYEGNEQMRVNDIINLAGGFLEGADANKVNLSQKLTDQMVIFVPAIGDETPELEISTETENNKKEKGKVNINTADESELQTLSGIGQKKAQDIISYRQENGSFKSIEELKNVSGFGEKTVEKLADFITV